MISIGIDLVEIKKFAPLLSMGNFLERCFCPSEITQFRESNQITYLAGRFAAKEAVLKALGTGLIDGLSFTDIEIIQLSSGAPEIRLVDKASELAHKLGIKKWFITISHTESYATAVVVGE